MQVPAKDGSPQGLDPPSSPSALPHALPKDRSVSSDGLDERTSDAQRHGALGALGDPMIT